MFKVNFKVKDARYSPNMEDLHIGGNIETLMEKFFYERATSQFARDYICSETEEQMVLRNDDSEVMVKWRGEFWGKFTISAARVARYHKDADLTEFLRQSAYRVLATADEDGYIGSYKDKENFMTVDPAICAKHNVFTPWNWNIWGRKYTLWGLLEIYMITGDEKILAGAHKTAIQLIEMLEKKGVKVRDTGAFWGLPSGSILKPMLLLYRLTGDERCLKFSQQIADEWEDPSGAIPNLITNGLANTPVHTWYPQPELWAKAYEMMSCLEGLLDLYRLTGVERYLQATVNIYDQIWEHEQNVLFSVGFNDKFSHAAVLQNSETEPCDVIHWMRLSYELYCITGDTKYMDVFELAYYNPFLAGVFNDGKWGARCVRSQGRPHEEGPACSLHFSHCCVSNMPRGYINAAQSYVFGGEDGLHIMLYTDFDCVIDGCKVSIGGSLFTDGKVSVSVEADKAKKLYLRIPAWSKSTVINGKAYTCAGEEVALDLVAGKNDISIQFELIAKIRDFQHPVEVFKLPDYRIRRFLQCNPLPEEIMRWEPSATLVYGPLLLVRTKLIGNTEQEMFRDKSIFGKGLTAKVTPVEDPSYEGYLYNVVFEGEGGFETKFCDLANGANRISRYDAWYYSVFV